MDRTVIFLHIQKSAGSTLNSILERQFPNHAVFPGSLSIHPNRRTLRLFLKHGFTSRQLMEEFYSLSEKKRNRVKFIHHHIPFGIHKELKQPCTYITMLRNPIDRIISLYYHLQRTTHINPVLDKIKKLSLTEFVASGIDDAAIPYGNNAQTYRISGISKDETIPDDETLRLAKKHLNDHFTAFGLSSRFNESLLFIGRQLGLSNKKLLYIKRQVATNKPMPEKIPEETLELIARHNKLDISLFEYAARLFEEKIQSQGNDFSEQLHQFENQLLMHQSKIKTVAYNQVLHKAIDLNSWIRSKKK